MKKIIVFLGPSLSLEEAQTILPDAYYLPPVRCGDILRALRLQPSIIAIIDGYFENTPAVWHKEILYAMEKGVIVAGASSMGALRAGELCQFGMQAIGDIAQAYASGKLEDDDEVVLLHTAERDHYRAITDPMVNIRATLEAALTQKIIDEKTQNVLAQLAKKSVYQNRTLLKAIEQAYHLECKHALLNHLKDWIDKNGMVDAKKQNAILLLEELNQLSLSSKITPANRTTFFRALQKNVMCRPFSSFQSWLPIQEKVALAARYLENTYVQIRRLAYLLSAVHSLAISLPHQPGSQHSYRKFKKYIVTESWKANNDINNREKKLFAKRMEKILNFCAQKNDQQTTVRFYLILLMKLSGDYLAYKDKRTSILRHFKKTNPVRFQAFYTSALLLRVIDRQADQLELEPDPQKVWEYSDKFRYKRQLMTQQQMESWLIQNDLDLNSYTYLMKVACRFSFLVLQNNLDVLGVTHYEEDVWWLLDALRLTGGYHAAKVLMNNPKKINSIQKTWIQKKQKLENFIFSLDFMGGEAELYELKTPD